MIYAYYPGCTLHSQARGFRESTEKSAAALGIGLAELPEWQCCGAAFPLTTDSLFPVLAAARNLASAARLGQPLVAVCSACYHVHKRTNRLIATDPEKRAQFNSMVEADYDGGTEVLHLLEAIRREVPADALAGKVKRPLSGLRVAAYYGCLLLRPEKELCFDDPEAPSVLEEHLRALGAQPVEFPYRGECCGSYLSVSAPQAAQRAAGNVLRSARRAGAEIVATSCPLCFYNLDEQQPALQAADYEFQPMPIVYFTQLLALALGVWDRPWHPDEHRVDPGQVLAGFTVAPAAPVAAGGGAAVEG
jgi:heterodisulfide reductase subunit B